MRSSLGFDEFCCTPISSLDDPTRASFSGGAQRSAAGAEGKLIRREIPEVPTCGIGFGIGDGR